MDFDFYFETYDTFCDLISNDKAAVFEIACGPGNITKYLLNRRPDFKIKGIDLAPNMVELARANNPTASFHVLDSRDISDDYEKSGFQTSIDGDQVYIHYHQLDFLKLHVDSNRFRIVDIKRKAFPVENGIPIGR